MITFVYLLTHMKCSTILAVMI